MKIRYNKFVPCKTSLQPNNRCKLRQHPQPIQQVHTELMDKAKNYVVDKFTTMEKPEATVTDVDFMKLSRDGATYLAKISVHNPYAVPIPICEISYSLKSDGREIASGKIPDPGSLKAKDKTMLDVPVKVPYNVLVSLGRDIAADWDIDYKLDVGLTIDIPVFGDITIPLSATGEVKLPSFSDYFSKK